MKEGGHLKPPSEAQIQLRIRSYLAALGIDAVHVPNGSHLAGDAVTRVKQANALKKAGVLPGMADLICFDRRVPRVGFIEVKRPGGSQSPAQIAFAELATVVWSLPYAVCRSVEDVRETLSEWGWR